MKKNTVSLICCAVLTVSLIISADGFAKTYKFSGGPAGGTYQYYASAIATLGLNAGIDIQAASSGGSVVNIRLVDSGKSDFGVAYSGDVFKAGNGMLIRDSKKYKNVLVLGRFYSAAAQLVVRADSGITAVSQLAGKNVGIGNFGSGAAATCELFLTTLGIWHKLEKRFLGYSKAADAFKKGQLDAFWVFTGFPNASVKQAALDSKIALVNTYKDADKSGLFKTYPYFSKLTIPANTYKGISEDIETFQDAALWIASAEVPEEDVYKLLTVVYSDNGLDYMRQTHSSAKDMSIQKGTEGIVTPFHPGAEKFWKEKRK
jgi:TRAP transporter TAXI family solute receptor